MNYEQRITQLKQLIESTLTPYITSNYVLYDLPYYSNIGDTLIWEGELCFLGTLGYKCIDTASRTTCTFPELQNDIIILVQGGGNLGDLYHEHMDFLIKLTEKYPLNRILVFPQTFFYNDKKRLQCDAELLATHKDLILCARDNESYSLLKTFFSNTILLLPDMAFCIPTLELNKYRTIEGNKTLLLKRSDCELDNEKIPLLPPEIDCKDWPTFEHRLNDGVFIGKVISTLSKLNLPIIGGKINKLWDFYAYRVYRKDLLRIGVKFVSQYRYIYSTRLHVFILAILLHKEVKIIDNSYKKNSTFYNTWLKDFDGAELI